jgi:hypothetical protein
VDFGGIGGGVWLRFDDGRLEGDDGGWVDVSDMVESEKSGVLGVRRPDDLLRTGRVARVDCCLRVIRSVRSWFCRLVVDEVWELALARVERVNDEEARLGCESTLITNMRQWVLWVTRVGDEKKR